MTNFNINITLTKGSIKLTDIRSIKVADLIVVIAGTKHRRRFCANLVDRLANPDAYLHFSLLTNFFKTELPNADNAHKRRLGTSCRLHVHWFHPDCNAFYSPALYSSLYSVGGAMWTNASNVGDCSQDYADETFRLSRLGPTNCRVNCIEMSLSRICGRLQRLFMY
jgi:hypothetical protein